MKRNNIRVLNFEAISKVEKEVKDLAKKYAEEFCLSDKIVKVKSSSSSFNWIEIKDIKEFIKNLKDEMDKLPKRYQENMPITPRFLHCLIDKFAGEKLI